jgi:hypothetical protein
MGDVLVAYPHKDEPGNNFAQSLLQMTLYDKGRLIATVENVRCPTGNLVVARNQMMRYLLENDFEWMFMIDDDMGFQVSALETLRAVADKDERPIVGGLCFSQRDMSRDGRNGYRWYPGPTIYDWMEFPDGISRYSVRPHYPVNGLVQCDGTGAAFLLIHRSVGERIFNEYGDVWFNMIEHPDGNISEDLSFFKRWTDLRGRGGCFVHTGVKTNHAKSTWLSETDFWTHIPVPPATDTVDVIVPVLHRPRNVRPVIESLRASTGLATAWFVCEPGDREEMDVVRECGGRVLQYPGSFAEKVNYAFSARGLSAPWIFITGDDVCFQPAWLDHAQLVAKEYGALVVGTNDLGNPRVTSGDHATHLLINRKYVAEVGATFDAQPGVVCGPYRHWFVDDELVAAAKERGVWQMALGSVVEHMHPMWDKGTDDEVYALGRSHAEADKALFEARAARFFGLGAAA